jgi:hypothetical protein
VATAADDAIGKPCNTAFNRDFPLAAANHWYWTLAYTLIPIPIFWLVGYGLLALARWIRAGFVTPH